MKNTLTAIAIGCSTEANGLRVLFNRTKSSEAVFLETRMYTGDNHEPHVAEATALLKEFEATVFLKDFKVAKEKFSLVEEMLQFLENGLQEAKITREIANLASKGSGDVWQEYQNVRKQRIEEETKQAKVDKATKKIDEEAMILHDYAEVVSTNMNQAKKNTMSGKVKKLDKTIEVLEEKAQLLRRHIKELEITKWTSNNLALTVELIEQVRKDRPVYDEFDDLKEEADIFDEHVKEQAAIFKKALTENNEVEVNVFVEMLDEVKSTVAELLQWYEQLKTEAAAAPTSETNLETVQQYVQEALESECRCKNRVDRNAQIDELEREEASPWKVRAIYECRHVDSQYSRKKWAALARIGAAQVLRVHDEHQTQ